jgi:hypothetical protein
LKNVDIQGFSNLILPNLSNSTVSPPKRHQPSLERYFECLLQKIKKHEILDAQGFHASLRDDFHAVRTRDPYPVKVVLSQMSYGIMLIYRYSIIVTSKFTEIFILFFNNYVTNL